jgi:hypothetical protein
LKDFDPVLHIEDFNDSPVVYLEFELRWKTYLKD